MAKLPIDLSKFKKTHEDEHRTTLAHPEGHTITLAHRLLSDKMKKQLAALPMLAQAASGQTPSGAAAQMPSGGPQPMAKGGSTVGQPINYPGADLSAYTPAKIPDTNLPPADTEAAAEKAMRETSQPRTKSPTQQIIESPYPEYTGKYDEGGEVKEGADYSKDYQPKFIPMTDEASPTPEDDKSIDIDDKKHHQRLDFTSYARGGQASADPTMPPPNQQRPSMESDPGALPTDSPIDYAVMGAAAPIGRAAMGAAEAIGASAEPLLANQIGAIGADVGEGAAARLAAKTATKPISQVGFSDKPAAAKEVLNKVSQLAEQGHLTLDDLKMAMQQANRKGFARGGDVDPTTEHLLPGDHPQNEIQKQVVSHQRARMAMGGEAGTDAQDSGGDQQQPQVVNNVEAVPQQQLPQAPQIDPAQARVRELYNIRANSNMQYEGRAGQPAPLEKLFGPNGNPPSQFDTMAWQQAEKDYQAEQAMSAGKLQKAQASIANQNEIRKRAGLPALQMPGTEMPVGSQEIPKDLSLAGPAIQPSQVQPNALKPEAAPGMGIMGGANNTQAPDLMHAYKTQLGGIYGQAKAEGALGQAEAGALDQSIISQKQQMDDFHKHYANLDNEYNNFIQDYKNQHIDPRHYLSSMGTGQKIGTAIGLILGGLAGPDNAPLQFLNKQISYDIEAQKAEMDKRQNLLSANLRQFGNLRDASAMTHTMQLGIVADQLKKAAAQAASPMAKARAMQAAGQIESSIAPIMYGLAAQQGIQQAGGGPIDQYLATLRMLAPERAKEIESRYIPGVGLASVPVEQKTRGDIMERKLLGDNIAQLEQFTQQHAGTLAGAIDPRIRAEGEALSKQVQDQYRRANSQGVFKPAEAEFVNGVIADSPSAFFAKYTKLPAYRMAQHINQGNLSALYQSVGLRPPGNMQQPAAPYRPKSFKPAGK